VSPADGPDSHRGPRHRGGTGPNRRDDGHRGDRNPADRYPADGYSDDRYPDDRYYADEYPADPYAADPYAADPYAADRRGPGQRRADRAQPGRDGGERYPDQRYGLAQPADRGYPNPGQPNPGQPIQGQAHPGQQYSVQQQPGHPNPGYPNPGYPNQGYAEPGYRERGPDGHGYGDRGYSDQGYNAPGYDAQSHRETGNRATGNPDERLWEARRQAPGPRQQSRQQDWDRADPRQQARAQPYREDPGAWQGPAAEPTRRLPAAPRTPPPASQPPPPQPPAAPPTSRLPGPPGTPPPVPGERVAEARPTTPVSRLQRRDARPLGQHRTGGRRSAEGRKGAEGRQGTEGRHETEGRESTDGREGTEGRRAPAQPDPPRQQRARADGRPVPPDRLVARADRGAVRPRGDETVAQPRPRRSGQRPPRPRADGAVAASSGATGQPTRITGAARPQGRPPTGRTAQGRSAQGRGGGLGRASGVMALGTIASRATGFLRTVAIAIALGAGAVSNAYNVANTIPNIVYDLLIGGILTSVVVPVLVRASKEDDDGGERFASSLLTLMILLLGVACVLGIALAPQIVDQYMHGVTGPKGAAEQALGATFLRWFMPQILCYGVGATIGAILNVRGSFAAPMFTPLLNNLAVIATCVAFTYVIAGPRPPDVDGAKAISGTQTAVLAAGTTLGVVLMTIALLPSLRKVGFRYRPRLDLNHPGLRRALRLAGWTFLWVIISQLGYLVITNLSTATDSFPVYTYAYQLFQLPYAIIGVSVITALLPRMSAHAADGDRDLVLDDLSTATRLSLTAIVPAALFLLALGRPIAVGVFNHGAFGYHSALSVGDTLSAFAVALVPFSVFQLHLRVFYAHQDSRTPSLVNIGVVGVNVTAALVISHALPAQDRALALALAFTVGYLGGLCVTCALLRRRLGGMDGDRIIATLARITVAAGIGAAAASAVAHGLRDVLGNGFIGSFSAVLVGAIVGLPLFVGTVTRMGIPEVRALTRMVSRRFRRG